MIGWAEFASREEISKVDSSWRRQQRCQCICSMVFLLHVFPTQSWLVPVLVGVLHELFGFLFVFPTQSWLVAMPELQLVHGLMVTNSREAVDTSGLVHLVHLMHLVWCICFGTGTRLVSPFVISLLGCPAFWLEIVGSVGYVFSWQVGWLHIFTVRDVPLYRLCSLLTLS